MGDPLGGSLFLERAHELNDRFEVVSRDLRAVCRHFSFAFGGDLGQFRVGLLLDVGRAEVAHIEFLAHRRLTLAISSVASGTLRFVYGSAVSGAGRYADAGEQKGNNDQ
jgi:hypothetical protein